MATHSEKATALAGKIVSKAEESLERVEQEMAMKKWPADLRAIMWDAIAEVASRRAQALR